MFESAVRRILPLAALLCLLPIRLALAQNGSQPPSEQLVIRELATAGEPDTVLVFVSELDGTSRVSLEPEPSLRQVFNRSAWLVLQQAGTTTTGGTTTGDTTTGTTTTGGTTTGDTTTGGTTTGDTTTGGTTTGDTTTGGTTTGETTTGGTTTGETTTGETTTGGTTTGGTTTGGTTTGGTTTGTTTTGGTTTGGIAVARILVLAGNNVPILFSPAVRMQDGSYVLHNANVTRGGVAIGVVNGKINRTTVNGTGSTQARADLFLTSVTVAGTVSTTHVSIPLTFNQISVSGSGP